MNTNWQAFAAAAYVDVLLDNAFTNFRTIMDAMTTNAGDGVVPDLPRQSKDNTTTGAQPDENYARELMQLFTHRAVPAQHGRHAEDVGRQPIETYTSADVSGLARVFTGLNYSSTDSSTPDALQVPLVMQASINETGAANFLGTSTTGGGMAAIKVALDTMFAHANVRRSCRSS